jgi:hypothetical protein
MMKKMPISLRIILLIPLAIVLSISACTDEGTLITKPDEHSRAFEGKEKVLLTAIVQVFKDKGFGVSTINREKGEVESTYLVQNGWRSKSIARVKKMNWKETEVTLSVITEKKVESGWEMRSLLKKAQYDSIFDAIELQMYQEMYKIE